MNIDQEFALDLPINGLSFGNVSVGILREVFKRGLTPNVFPLNRQVDISAHAEDTRFNQWLSHCINKAQKDHCRKKTSIKLWHIDGSMSSYSETDSRLITFHELDSLTSTEINILKNQDKVYVTSKYTQSVFSMFGVEADYMPLGFDSFNFKPLEKRPKIEGVRTWGIFGKLEPLRKSHLQMIAAWVKKYGNNTAHRLNLAVSNPFLKEQDFKNILGSAFQGKNYYNVNILPYQPSNAAYNQLLQANDIVLAVSKGEGRDLPLYHATAMGAWPVAMKAHAYLDYLNKDNAILVNPNGKCVANDGIFFHNNPSNSFNQGNMFTFSDEEFVAAMEEADKRAEKGLNTEGFKLQQLTYKDTVDVLLKDIK